MPGWSSFSEKLRFFSRACAILSVAAGVAVLAGWAFDVPLLKAPAPGLAQMKANAALCFALGGIALWLLSAGEGRRRHAGAALGVLVALLGAASLGQDLLKWDLGIDELLFRDPEIAAPGAPGRLAPAAAVNFLLLGGALATLANARLVNVAQGLATAGSLVAVLFLLGYLFGVEDLYEMRGFTTVAVYAAVAMLVLSMGILCAHAEEGWISEIAGDTDAARARRPILAAALVVLPLAGWLRLRGERAGLYGPEMGVAILVVVSMLVIICLAMWSTAQANAAEAKNRSYAERLAILHEIDRGLIENRTPETIAEAALRPLRDLLGVPRAIVNLFNFETGQVEWLVAIGRQRMHTGPGDIEALRRGEPQVIDTLSLPPSPHKDALLASRVEMYMAVPMIAGGELIGALSFGGEAREFPQEQVAVAQEAAAQLAIAVAQARLHERVQRQAGELEQRVQERTSELQQRSTELELANKELESFSYTVSHDLRTPLRAVDGFARIFEEDYGDKVDAEGRRLLGVIRDSSRRMGTLIDDLLAFSMLGRQALHPVEVDMGALAGEIWAELGDASPASFVLAPLPLVRGDRALLRQVWANLLSNALKYSAKRAAPAITVSCERREDELVYCVADNGAGFDPRYYAKLFGVFQRLHAETEFAGTGVGLATVQRVVARHGGRVWAESEVGAGAKFYFSLPAGEK
jgi:signal transduction histidine kinase